MVVALEKKITAVKFFLKKHNYLDGETTLTKIKHLVLEAQDHFSKS